MLEKNYLEGISGLYKIALENEVQWNAIVNETIKKEFVAFTENNVELLNESTKEMFHKTIKIMNETLESLEVFAEQFRSDLEEKQTLIENFILSNSFENKFINNDAIVEVRQWNKNVNEIAEYTSTCMTKLSNANIDGKITPNDIASLINKNFNYNNIDKVLKNKFCLNESSILIDEYNINPYLTNMNCYSDLVDNFDNIHSNLIDNICHARDCALEGLDCDDPEQRGKIVDCLKNRRATAIVNLKLEAAGLESMLASINDSLKVINVSYIK